MELAPVTCPSCFEIFEVVLPREEETPCELDYDCEICCRPLLIQCWIEEGSGSMAVEALGLGD